MKRYLVLRFTADEQPIAKADFATREEADDCYEEYVKCGGRTGGVEMRSPAGFVIKRLVYGKAKANG